MIYEKWVKEKPEFDAECIVICVVSYTINGKIETDYSSYMVKQIDGYNSAGEQAWYWGWLDLDGEEQGDLADMTASAYYVIPIDEEGGIPARVINEM
jgi:hypothetical protein